MNKYKSPMPIKASGVSKKDTVTHHFNWIFGFTDKHVEIEIPKMQYTKIYSPKTIIVKDSVFRTMICRRCGRCCKNYWSIYDEGDEKFLIDMKEKYEKITIRINFSNQTISKTLFIVPKPKNQPECRFLIYDKNEDMYKCKVYKNRPLLSRMPHLFYRETEHEIQIVKRQFGRNFRLGCQSFFEPYCKEELEKDFNVLQYVNTKQLRYLDCFDTFKNKINEMYSKGKAILSSDLF